MTSLAMVRKGATVRPVGMNGLFVTEGWFEGRIRVRSRMTAREYFWPGDREVEVLSAGPAVTMGTPPPHPQE